MSPPPRSIKYPATNPASVLTQQEELRKMLSGIDFEPLYEVWHGSEGGIADSLEPGILSVLYEVCAARAVAKGEVFLAEELAARGRKMAESIGFDPTRCYQLEARAIARSGSISKAAEILMRLSKVADDGESKGLLAARYRDFAFEEPHPERRRKLFEEALYHAKSSFEKHPTNYYNGIQAAQFAFFAGAGEEAGKLLRKVEKLCDERERRSYPAGSQEPFWLHVTRAEAALIRGDIGKAEFHYRNVADEEDSWPADLDASRKVATEIIRHQGGGVAFNPIREVLKPRPVAIFSGHLFDCGRSEAGLPPRLPAKRRTMRLLSESFDEFFQREKPLAVYASLSIGADLLFTQAALRFYNAESARRRCLAIQSGRSHLQGPPPVYLFVAFDIGKALVDAQSMAWRMSEEQAPNELKESYAAKWRTRLLNLLKTLPRSRIYEAAFPPNAGLPEAYAHTNALMTGMALLKANETGSELRPVVVFAEGTGELGGAEDFAGKLPGSIRANVVNLYREEMSGL